MLWRPGGVLEGRRLGHARAQIVADRTEHEAEQERHAPTPGGERVRGKVGGEQVGGERGGGRADLGAELLPAPGDAALAGLGVFDQERRRAAPLAAGGEALPAAADQQQDGREQADLRVGRDQAGASGRQRHQPDRDDERRAAPVPIAIGADDHRAERPEQEADAEGDEGVDQRQRIVAGRKERMADRHGEEPVEHEVEQLEEIADRAGDDRAPSQGLGGRGGEVDDGVAHAMLLPAGATVACGIVSRGRAAVTPPGPRSTAHSASRSRQRIASKRPPGPGSRP